MNSSENKPAKRKLVGKKRAVKRYKLTTGWTEETVEKIIDFKFDSRRNKNMYLVKWEQWPEEYNEWVSEEDFFDPDPLMTDFWKDLGQKADLLNAPTEIRQSSKVTSALVYMRAVYTEV